MFPFPLLNPWFSSVAVQLTVSFSIAFSTCCFVTELIGSQERVPIMLWKCWRKRISPCKSLLCFHVGDGAKGCPDMQIRK